MKLHIHYLLFFIPFAMLGQEIQTNAPWAENAALSRSENPTLQEIAAAAKNYFSTIDSVQKGSGLKPFRRWEYHTKNYLNDDGTIAPASKLWDAWDAKNTMRQNAQVTDLSNWQALGPFNNSNTYSANNKQQSGQGRVNAIAVDPSNSHTYYVGAPAGGIWKSTNSGVDWTPLTDHLPQIGVSGIAIHPTDSNILYIATGDDDAGDSYAVGVWKSIDGGANWNATGSVPGNPSSMNEIYIDPNSPETILVATSSGVKKSIDGGDSWVTKLNGNIIDLKMKPGDASIWYAVTSNTFYRSTDSGETFTSVNIPELSNSSRLTMDVTPANAAYVYMVSAGSGSAFNGVYRSTDSGASFTKTTNTADIFDSTQAWYDLALTVSSNNPDIIYVGVLDIWKSTNGGNSFTKINEWHNPNQDSYTHADIHFMRFIGGRFFVGSDGGIYVSDNEGVLFTDLTENLAISMFYTVSVSPQNSNNIAGGLQDNGGYAYNDNLWRNYHGGDGMEGLVDPTAQNTHYGFTQYGGSLTKTIDGGRTRVSSTNAPATGNGNWVTPLVSNNIGEIYAGYAQLHKLEGNTWTAVSNHFFSANLTHIEIDPHNNDIMYVSSGSNLYKSTDAGVNFNQLDFSHGSIKSIEVSNTDSNKIWVVTSYSVYTSANIHEAIPVYTNITGNLPSESKITLKHHVRSGNNTVYLGTTLGVYFLNDDATEWETFDTNLPNVAVRDLEINEEDAKLYAATYGRGMFVSNIPRVLPVNDARMISINAPNNSMTCSDTIAPEITVKNQGATEITAMTIAYTFDGGATSSYEWTGNLASEDNTVITLPATSLSVANHTLTIEVLLTDDAYSSNNALTSDFIVNNFNTTPTTINTFENNEDVLLTESSTGISLWALGVPNQTLLNTVASGSKAYATNLTGNHPDATTAYLYTRCYDLASITNPVLSFQMAFDIENDWDHMYVEYSTDQGGNWEILGDANDENWYNSASTENGLPGKQWTGEGENLSPLGATNATLHEYSYNLAAFTNEPNMLFRFMYLADAVVNEEGVLLDDLVVTGILPVDDFDLLKTVAIYPNPSSAIFTITWPGSETLSIEVFDITGKRMVTQKQLDTHAYHLDLSDFAKGVYFVKLQMKGQTSTKKLILQ